MEGCILQEEKWYVSLEGLLETNPKFPKNEQSHKYSKIVVKEHEAEVNGCLLCMVLQ